MYKEIEGDLIALAEQGLFDVILHGCNCMNKMGKGLTLQMKQRFGCDTFPLEQPEYRGDINKLGNIDADTFFIGKEKDILVVLNCYTQYDYAKKSDPPDAVYVDCDAIK